MGIYVFLIIFALWASYFALLWYHWVKFAYNKLVMQLTIFSFVVASFAALLAIFATSVYIFG